MAECVIYRTFNPNINLQDTDEIGNPAIHIKGAIKLSTELHNTVTKATGLTQVGTLLHLM